MNIEPAHPGIVVAKIVIEQGVFRVCGNGFPDLF